jgi:hypothetical protein
MHHAAMLSPDIGLAKQSNSTIQHLIASELAGRAVLFVQYGSSRDKFFIGVWRAVHHRFSQRQGHALRKNRQIAHAASGHPPIYGYSLRFVTQKQGVPSGGTIAPTEVYLRLKAGRQKATSGRLVPFSSAHNRYTVGAVPF